MKILKNVITSLLIFSLIACVYGAVVKRGNSTYELSQKRILFTDTGYPTGNKIMDINSGGLIVIYGTLQDSVGNKYSTGGGGIGTEVDPIWSGEKGNYIKRDYVSTGTAGGNSDTLIMSQRAVSGFIRSFGFLASYTETDPIRNASSGNYLLKANSGDYFNSNSGSFAKINSNNVFTGTNTFTSKSLCNSIYVYSGEYSNGVKTGDFTITWTNGQKQNVTISGTNLQMSFTGINSNEVGNFLLRIIQGGAGSKTISFDSGTVVKFPGGTNPTLSTGAGNIDILSLYFDGTSRYGGVGLNYN